MNGNDTNENTQTFDVVVTRIFDAPVDEVWKAWRDPEYVRRWWGPTGFTSPSAEMDFRVGGASLVCMRAPAEYGGQDMYHTWTYTRIDPLVRIEFVSNFADKEGRHLDPGAMGMPQGIPHDVPHVIVFKAAGDKGTEMTVTEHGYTTEQARDLSRAGMEQCLDKMAAIFAEEQVAADLRLPEGKDAPQHGGECLQACGSCSHMSTQTRQRRTVPRVTRGLVSAPSRHRRPPACTSTMRGAYLLL